MKKFLLALALLFATPAFAQSPGFTGWQSGVFDTGSGAVIMPAPTDPNLRNYLKHIYCDATAKPAPGVMQMNIKTMRNGTLTIISFFSVLAGQTDGIHFEVPLWGDTGAAITMAYRSGGGPAHCTWEGFVGQ